MDENFTELRGEIAGPPDTPYEGIPPQVHCNDPTRYLLQAFLMICHAKHFVVVFSLYKEAGISLKSKSQKPILLTLQRYVLHKLPSGTCSSSFGSLSL